MVVVTDLTLSPSTLPSTPCISDVDSQIVTESLSGFSSSHVCSSSHIPTLTELSAPHLIKRGLYDTYLARLQPQDVTPVCKSCNRSSTASRVSSTRSIRNEGKTASVKEGSVSSAAMTTSCTPETTTTTPETPLTHTTVSTEPRGPATPRTRERIRQRYAEKAKERYARMYETAILIAREREREDGLRHRAKRSVEFRIHYSTDFGQNIYLTGNISQLGSWNVGAAVPLEWTPGNLWVGRVDLSADAGVIEYKYVVRDSNSRYTLWESGQNHKLDLVAAKQPLEIVQDYWGSGSR